MSFPSGEVFFQCLNRPCAALKADTFTAVSSCSRWSIELELRRLCFTSFGKVTSIVKFDGHN